MKNSGKVAVAAGVGTLMLGGALVGLGQLPFDNPDDFPAFNENPGLTVNDLGNNNVNERPGVIEVFGVEVDNLFEGSNPLITDFCRSSNLDAGEGKNNKGGTCVSYPIGEIPKNSVRVTVENPPTFVNKGDEIKIKIRVEDKDGPLDLNAFTFDESGGAGTTFLENPGALDENGRPFLHCHLGVATLDKKDGLPGETYDAAFKGVQGLKGDVDATINGLEPGFYRADVYCSQPGHLALPTGTATQLQAFDSFRFEVN